MLRVVACGMIRAGCGGAVLSVAACIYSRYYRRLGAGPTTMVKRNLMWRTLFYIAAVAVARAAVTVQSPMEYQVFQRVTAKEGRIAVRAQGDSCDAAEVRVESGPWR